LFGAAGLVLGGVAGTADWPVVGSFFGAVEGACVGALVGVLAGVAVGQLGRWTRATWALRAVSGLLGGGAAGFGAVTYRGPIVAPSGLTAALVAVAVVASAALGPLLLAGVPTRPLRADRVVLKLGQFLVLGVAAGAAVGAVAGLVLGLRAYPATAPFAAVEGAMFGAANGAVLACVAAGLRSLTRRRLRH
jgi:hypothetical protein